MKTSDFFYELPPELIAQHPTEKRDGARMMVIDRSSQSITHKKFTDIPSYLNSGDLLVMNNTRVVPARVRARKKDSGGAVELFFLERVNSSYPEVWNVLLKSNRRPKSGQVMSIDGSSLEATFLENLDRGQARIEVNGSVLEMLEAVGETPLPPYIQREENEAEDKSRYQTVFAAHPGAVAAPTAGLHFTPAVLDELDARGVNRAEVTLHVGLGTFQSVEADELENHVMHSERYLLPEVTAAVCNQTRSAGGRVFGVGSTSVRTLETVMKSKGEMKADEGRSDLFIYPPYSFKAIDGMLTNFHLPCSTLIMMVSAFAGKELTLEAYRQAVEERYRFFSYGDCMLIF